MASVLIAGGRCNENDRVSANLRAFHDGEGQSEAMLINRGPQFLALSYSLQYILTYSTLHDFSTLERGRGI